MVNQILHRELLCAGGIDTAAKDPSRTDAAVLATVSERVYAVRAGSLAWVRGTFCSAIPANGSARLPIPDDPGKYFAAESLMRLVLAEFGVSIRYRKPVVESRSPMLFLARTRNAYYLSSYSPSSAVAIDFRMPQGAPLLAGSETWLNDGHSTYTLPRSAHHEIRCFVDDQASGEISCNEHFSGHIGIRRRLLLKGLRNATVRFLREDSERVIISNDLRLHNEKSIPYTTEDNGRLLVARNVMGQLLISW